MFSFGSGVMFGARTDIANATPINFGLLQEVNFDFSFNVKELYGQYQFPLAIARGTGKFTGKAKLAAISGLMMNNLFFGQTLAAGQIATAFGETGTVASAAVTVANSATFVDDYGVVYSTTGLPFTKVASSPAVGQYSVSAGVYTFASGDNAAVVLISYTYTVSGSGQKITINNQLLGTTPVFQAQFYTIFQSKPMNLKLFQVTSSKLGLATKLEDFVMPEMDFQVFANAAGNIGVVSLGEAS